MMSKKTDKIYFALIIALLVLILVVISILVFIPSEGQKQAIKQNEISQYFTSNDSADNFTKNKIEKTQNDLRSQDNLSDNPKNEAQRIENHLQNNSVIADETAQTYYFDNITYLVLNGAPSEKLNVFFIPLDVSKEFFHESMKNMLYSEGRQVSNTCGDVDSRGIFEVEPFKSNLNKFNVLYSEKEFNSSFFGCSYTDMTSIRSKSSLYCNLEKIKSSVGQKVDVIVLVGQNYTTSASPFIIYYGDQESVEPIPYQHGFVHEFAHAFGGLNDEYGGVYSYKCDGWSCHYTMLPDLCADSASSECFVRAQKEISYIPNEDIIGCPKWCAAYDRDKLFKLSESCIQKKTMSECVVGAGNCLWFNQKHPWFDANCVPRKTFEPEEDIGLDCSDPCVMAQHPRHLSFFPGCSNDNGGMMSNLVGDFNIVSKNHLQIALKCCFPPQHSEECRIFSEKFTLPPDMENHPFKSQYDFFSTCYSLRIN
ncbi:MAG: hypothetical protein Q8O89_06975 [Nanoarchaeota archaeon]|nr:hypothetical protein [Nanoarchaeota archaeon]